MRKARRNKCCRFRQVDELATPPFSLTMPQVVSISKPCNAKKRLWITRIAPQNGALERKYRMVEIQIDVKSGIYECWNVSLDNVLPVSLRSLNGGEFFAR
ncbi:MAG: hypothetical protein RLZZ519_3096 [Bacteroidota bacterium]|jgi:hypothetical protein